MIQLPAPASQSSNALSAPQADAFTPQRQAIFLQALADWGNVRAACKAAAIGKSTVYRLRRTSDEFAELWEGAQLLARQRVEDELADRALNGTEEAVFYHGEEVARRRRYDARLLLAHLGRLDKLGYKRSAQDAAIGFDRRVDALEEGHALDSPDPQWDEDEYGEEDEGAEEDAHYGEGFTQAEGDEWA